jgi:hypothetical protein
MIMEYMRGEREKKKIKSINKLREREKKIPNNCEIFIL